MLTVRSFTAFKNAQSFFEAFQGEWPHFAPITSYGSKFYSLIIHYVSKPDKQSSLGKSLETKASDEPKV